MPASSGDFAVAGAKRMAFQREHEYVSPRGLFDKVEPKGSRRFLTAAVAAFSGRGYHATTTRDIAAIAGASPAAIYTYYATKADLLYQIALIGHNYILQETAAALESSDNPAEAVAEMVRRSVSYHAEEHVLVHVVNADFRSLDVSRLAAILKIRRTISDMVRDVVRSGVQTGAFDVEHIDGAAIAILRLMDVAPWYNERGPMTPAELAEVYVGLILRMLGTSDDRGNRDTAIDR